MRSQDLVVGDLYEYRLDGGREFYIYLGRGRMSAGGSAKLAVYVPEAIGSIAGWRGREPGQRMLASQISGYIADYPSTARPHVFVEVSGPRHRSPLWSDLLCVAHTVRSFKPAERYDPQRAQNIARISIEQALSIHPKRLFAVSSQFDRMAFRDLTSGHVDLLVDEAVRVTGIDRGYADCVGADTGTGYRVDLQNLWFDYDYTTRHKALRVAEMSARADQKITSVLRSFHDDQGFPRSAERPSADTRKVILSWPLLLKILDGSPESAEVFAKLIEAALEISGATADLDAMLRQGSAAQR